MMHCGLLLGEFEVAKCGGFRLWDLRWSETAFLLACARELVAGSLRFSDLLLMWLGLARIAWLIDLWQSAQSIQLPPPSSLLCTAARACGKLCGQLKQQT